MQLNERQNGDVFVIFIEPEAQKQILLLTVASGNDVIFCAEILPIYCKFKNFVHN